jgi:hypothetical protein
MALLIWTGDAWLVANPQDLGMLLRLFRIDQLSRSMAMHESGCIADVARVNAAFDSRRLPCAMGQALVFCGRCLLLFGQSLPQISLVLDARE